MKNVSYNLQSIENFSYNLQSIEKEENILTQYFEKSLRLKILRQDTSIFN